MRYQGCLKGCGAFLLAGLLAATSIADDQIVSPASLLSDDGFGTASDAQDADYDFIFRGHGSDLKHDRPDSHAPAGLMGDHLHKAGEVMAEYKFMSMNMNGNRAGTQRLSPAQARAFDTGFMVAPTSMQMDMHMVHLMYAPTDNITMYVMPMYLAMTMDHERGNGTTFVSHNEGIGDLPFGFLWGVHESDVDELILNVGFSAPTGNIARRTTAPTNGNPPGLEFPYPMRLGSGTFDFRPGATYKYYMENCSFGLQGTCMFPASFNYDDYSVGQEYRLNAWFSHRISPDRKLSASFRVEHIWREDFAGADNDLNPAIIHTNRPDFRGGEWLNFGYGLIYLLPHGGRANFEMTHPVYQDLNGVQLQTSWMLFASYSKAF